MSQTEHQTSAATSATGTRKTPRVEAEKIILGIDPGTNVLGYGVLCVSGRQVKMQAMGVIDLRRVKDVYLKLGRIHERVMGIIDSFLPDEVAIEAPFFGKNVQSMLKLGRAQGVAIAAAISRDIPIHEYAPLKIKMAITANGQASKEQVAGMMHRCTGRRLLPLPASEQATNNLGSAALVGTTGPETGTAAKSRRHGTQRKTHETA